MRSLRNVMHTACVMQASPVMHAFGACVERIASPITAKLQIALKEANETGYWLELLFKTNYITEAEYKSLDSVCTSIRVMLISSINTAKENSK